MSQLFSRLQDKPNPAQGIGNKGKKNLLSSLPSC